ncbi:hypothetical protein [Vibrio aestuarianus]|uniref:Uncharacterized protein n=1 Tax=Vibrio aestuarianus TaxID=28171 RepID=A0ABN8TRA0_9VIBR|nr:hypothetical protein [Vibrio aestuarianus]MDE1229080.1 hypothetical protein [Vibrio aestuarianus]MDE1255188.1 hypothetical protein [Vibrio aestuarianus]MDE1272462.1 hypothetical protein [Vibrio aestuarianus]MDE1294582.1 hypothetical protein [Vibrio aestuarianus]MDH5892886.1 hypothetical protein [Vibrio aestuarianus]
MKDHLKSDDSDAAVNQQQALDLCQLVDEAFQSGLIKSREDLDVFLDQKLRIVMVSELQNRSEYEAKELLEKRKESIVLLALCRIAEEDIKAGRGLTSIEIKERLQARKFKPKH